jgi:hypothetical protein
MASSASGFSCMERLISLTASLITISNAAFAFPALGTLPSISFAPSSVDPLLYQSSIPIRAGLAIVLTVSAAHVFGLFFRSAGRIASAELSLVLWTMIAVLSAVLTVFNLERVLIGHQVGSVWQYAALFLLYSLASSISIFFAAVHVEEHDSGVVAWCQGIVSLLIFVSLPFRG